MTHPITYMDRALRSDHRADSCPCFMCACAREAIGAPVLEPDYAELFGVRFDPLTTAPEPVTDQDIVPMLASIGVGLLLGVLVFLALLEAV